MHETILSEFLNSVEIGVGPQLCLEIACLEVDGNYKSLLTTALDLVFGRVKTQSSEQDVHTLEIANSVDHPEKFMIITCKENFPTFFKECRHNLVTPTKKTVGNKECVFLTGPNKQMLVDLKEHALKFNYLKPLEFFSRFNMFTMMLPL